MRQIITLICFLTLPTIACATGGQISNPSENCSGAANKIVSLLVQEANTDSYEYMAINKSILLNDGTSVTVTYDKYIYDIGKENVASYISVVLDVDCNFIEAARADDL